MSSVRQSIDTALELYLELIQANAELSLEFEASITEFYGGPPPVASARDTLMAARRHLEWFVLERHSPTLASRPAEALVEQWQELIDSLGEEIERPSDDELRALHESIAGLFEVGSVEPGKGAWLRDLAGLGEYPIIDEGAARAFVVGDVVMGRLFPVGGGAFHLSTAAGIHRDERLRDALTKDLERTREDRSTGKVLRVSQRDIEAMFWLDKDEDKDKRKYEEGDSNTSETVDPCPAAREFFRTGGLDDVSIDSLFAGLQLEPMNPERLVVGAGDTLGVLLEELAFETDVDLGKARGHLVAVWVWYSTHSDDDPGVVTPQPRPKQNAKSDAGPLGEGDADPEDKSPAALRAFDKRRKSGASLDELFNALESELELPPDEDSDDEDSDDDGEGEADGSEYSGFEESENALEGEHFTAGLATAEKADPAETVLGQIVAEFLWETGLEADDDQLRRYRSLDVLVDFGKQFAALEDLKADDLLRFSCFWIPEHRKLADAKSTSDLMDALAAFCAWCEDSHCVMLRSDFSQTLESLRESLPRIVEANHALGRAALDPNDTGELYWVKTIQDGKASMTGPDGQEHQILLPLHLHAWLRDGDGLRGRIQIDDSLSVFCCYPPEARGLLGG
ncbi:MAG: hypothetical protein ACI835_001983 [Planctomycetota bacterium]|jgi:hypothetical protein